eukprot:gnl/MRDRNA2_/MRDRNA2_86412_c0_seq1.p1 gnl/MRDRNA2_/MRDRNA2_86412_c0~~gnl/MRDRNA2_/MRDRNA2_86412_c0_seq1.p1  ORF type:complete len:617 (-),score=136.15 gnl/MRDRNA2_/MRDRNA2_86412_c0_seq1:324-2174(-)
MQSILSNPSAEDLRNKLRLVDEEQKRLKKQIYIEELRAKLQAAQEQQKNLEVEIQQAEQEANGPEVNAKPESVESTVTQTIHQETSQQDVGGPNSETPRTELKVEETWMAPASRSRKGSGSSRSNPLLALQKLRSQRHAEDEMVLNLDLDNPTLDEERIQQLYEVFTLIEELLHTAAQRVVGHDSEVIVEAEVIGACAIMPVAFSDTIDILCRLSKISSQLILAVFTQMLEADPAASCIRQHPEAFKDSQMLGLRFSYAKFDFRVFVAKVPWEENDSETFQSLNGCVLARTVNEMISNSTSNSFGHALRMVKFWAKRRGIYGKEFGYPGGLTWSICLARICQMYPDANAAKLAAHFFKVYSTWNWRTAVALAPLDGNESFEYNPVEEGTIAVMCPGAHVNTAAHIKKSVFPVLQEELRRAYKICKKIVKSRGCWSELYALPNISRKRKHYLRLEFAAQTQQALNLLVEWGQEVCITALLAKFEKELPQVQVTAWSHWVACQHDNYSFACTMIIGLRFMREKGQPQQTIDLRIPVLSFLEMMDKWPYKEKFAGQYDTMLQHLRQPELQQWLELRSVKDLASKELCDSNEENMDNEEAPAPLVFSGQTQFSCNAGVMA